jgi:TetR/AcrR family transcriptional regulator, repressor for uid operon
MPKITADDHQRRQKEILRRCVDCFARKGFHQTSMRELSSELGMSLGGLYTYFKSKEDIIKAFIDRDRAVAKLMFSAVTPEMTFWEGIERMAVINNRAMAEAGSKKTCAVWMQINAEAAINPKVRKLVTAHYRYAIAQLSALIRAGQERGEILVDVDPSALASNLISFSDGLNLWQMLSPGTNADKHVDLFLRMLKAGVGQTALAARRRSR